MSREAVTHYPIEIPDRTAILTEFRTDAECKDLLFRMRDEVVQKSDALKGAQAEIESINQTVKVKIESADRNLEESLQLKQQAWDAFCDIFDENRFLEVLGGALLETGGVLIKLEDFTI